LKVELSLKRKLKGFTAVFFQYNPRYVAQVATLPRFGVALAATSLTQNVINTTITYGMPQ